MSIKHMNDVWKFSEAKGISRFLLLAIADNADEYGEAYPGVPYLAKKTGLGGRTIRKHVRKLIELDELQILQRGGYRGGVAKANLYRVTVGAKRHDVPVDSDTLRSEAAHGADEQAPRAPSYRHVTTVEQAPRAPQPPVEPSVKETKEETKEKNVSQLGDFVEWLEHYESVTGREAPRDSSLARERFRERIAEGFPVEELKAATWAAHMDEWHCGQGFDVPTEILSKHRIERLGAIAQSLTEDGYRDVTLGPVHREPVEMP